VGFSHQRQIIKLQTPSSPLENNKFIKMKSNNYSLLWKLTISFIVLLVLNSMLIVYLFFNTSLNYERESNQKLNKNIASQIVKDVTPLMAGAVYKKNVQEIMHYLMAINPSIQVYVLDPVGNILTYVAPKNTVVRTKVDLNPIKTFINSNGNNYVEGDDPRDSKGKNVFSAAPVIENNKLIGYVYVILASNDTQNLKAIIQNSYFFKMALKYIFIIIFISLLTGFLIFWFLTKNINDIVTVFKKYSAGDLTARSTSKGNSDFSILSETFNEMADTIESKITTITDIDNMRKELIANISHDLRTPIASLSGYSELMIDKNEILTPSERNKYLNTIYSNAKKMEKQIQDLFELSKLESVDIKINKEPFHLGELIVDITNKFKIIANQKGVHLNSILSSDVTIINADISLIDRMIQNLIDNAIKMCKSGDSVNIIIDKKDESIQLIIQDTGPGIPANELPHIFERFNKGLKNKENSTGLGLSIVKRILELHNYTISVLSKEKEGASFIITL
jgi:signal transduction histidine kinase